MKCSRLSDAVLTRVLLAEVDAYLKEYPDCPRPLAAYEVLNKKQGGKTGQIVDELNQLNEYTYSANIVGKWRRGIRPVPRNIEGYMRGQIIRCLVGPVGDDLVALLGEQ